MFSRTLRNLRSAGSLFALALLAFAVVAAAVDTAEAAQTRHFVDGSGMSDRSDDPRHGHGGGSLEGDPWGGEQRPSDSADPDTPTLSDGASTLRVSTVDPSDRDFWSWLMSLWAFLLR
ncbi:MAG TPA: hypothetical protein VKA86_07540 [Candidatus Krumholzibacteria bacterium]|nr:hypothetical protein [Candidatus Krumholzibacteria bacterium]